MRKKGHKAAFLIMVGLLSGCIASHENGTGSSGVTADVQKKPQEQTELLVSAAASLQESLKEFAELYAKSHSGTKLTFNFGSSGALQRQIEQGAPADLFISAGKKQMDVLQDKHLLAEKQVNLVTNALVVIVPQDSHLELTSVSDLSKATVQKIAIGESEAVPAGTYAKESLSFYKLWDALQPKYVFAKDVRQVLNYVEAGNVDAGFVYQTDALTSTKVKVAFTTKAESHKLIEYPAGIVKDTKHLKDAEALLNELQTEAAADIFRKYGFAKPNP